MRSMLVLGGLALVLGVASAQIVSKERVVRDGTMMLVELAPIDPRSLIQGDYMRLDYAISRQLNRAAAQRDGVLVVVLDAAGVAQFSRVHASGQPLGPDEHLLRYRVRKRIIRIGTDAFYFQEGHGPFYDSARFGELRVDASGDSVLVGLRDRDRKPLGAPVVR
jgi:uncharacterized membrane-anchored protein